MDQTVGVAQPVGAMSATDRKKAKWNKPAPTLSGVKMTQKWNSRQKEVRDCQKIASILAHVCLAGGRGLDCEFFAAHRPASLLFLSGPPLCSEHMLPCLSALVLSLRFTGLLLRASLNGKSRLESMAMMLFGLSPLLKTKHPCLTSHPNNLCSRTWLMTLIRIGGSRWRHSSPSTPSISSASPPPRTTSASTPLYVLFRCRFHALLLAAFLIAVLGLFGFVCIGNDQSLHSPCVRRLMPFSLSMAFAMLNA